MTINGLTMLAIDPSGQYAIWVHGAEFHRKSTVSTPVKNKTAMRTFQTPGSDKSMTLYKLSKSVKPWVNVHCLNKLLDENGIVLLINVDWHIYIIIWNKGKSNSFQSSKKLFPHYTLIPGSPSVFLAACIYKTTPTFNLPQSWLKKTIFCFIFN